MEQLQSIEERLSAIQSLLDGLTGRGERAEAQFSFDAINGKLDSIETLIRSVSASSPAPRVIEDAIHEALMRLYRMLRDNGELVPPRPIAEPATLEGNVLLPLDPDQQHELLLMNPIQPDLYGARIILHSSYTTVYRLPYMANSDTQRFSLHIHTHKAPPGFADMLRTFQEGSHECMYLAQRRRLSPDTFEVIYWPCVETVHAEDLRKYPYDVCFYFDTNPGNQSRRYSVERMPGAPSTPPGQANGATPTDQQVTPDTHLNANTAHREDTRADTVSPATWPFLSPDMQQPEAE